MSHRSVRRNLFVVGLGAALGVAILLAPRPADALPDNPDESKPAREAPKASRVVPEAECERPRESRADRDRRDLAEDLGETRGSVELLEIELAALKQRIQGQAQFLGVATGEPWTGGMGGGLMGGMGGGLGGSGGGFAASEPDSPEAREKAKRRVDELRRNYEKSKDRYLELSRQLGRERQRLYELEVQVNGRPRARPGAAPDIERRLGDIERKLDALLNAGGLPKP